MYFLFFSFLFFFFFFVFVWGGGESTLFLVWLEGSISFWLCVYIRSFSALFCLGWFLFHSF